MKTQADLLNFRLAELLNICLPKTNRSQVNWGFYPLRHRRHHSRWRSLFPRDESALIVLGHRPEGQQLWKVYRDLPKSIFDCNRSMLWVASLVVAMTVSTILTSIMSKFLKVLRLFE